MQHKNTLFIGKVLLRYPELPSTNSSAQELLAKSKPSEGTVLFTANQTKGRGQIGSSWVSEAGANIAMSVILYPQFLAPVHQFDLNLAVALAAWDCLHAHVPGELRIKWPNDIYVANRKIAGILIQNSLGKGVIQSSVVGIGLNVNQLQFPADLRNATSLRLETGRTYVLELLLEELCYYLEARYLQLRAQEYDQLKAAYLLRLFRRGVWSSFADQNGTVFSGNILGIDRTGKLEMETGDGRKSFSIKEITFI